MHQPAGFFSPRVHAGEKESACLCAKDNRRCQNRDNLGLRQLFCQVWSFPNRKNQIEESRVSCSFPPLKSLDFHSTIKILRTRKNVGHSGKARQAAWNLIEWKQSRSTQRSVSSEVLCPLSPLWLARRKLCLFLTRYAVPFWPVLSSV